MDQISPWQLGGAAAGASTLGISTNISSTGSGSISLTTAFSSGQTFVDLYWDSVGVRNFSESVFRLDFRTSNTNAKLLYRLGTQSGPVYESLGTAAAADTFTTFTFLPPSFSGNPLALTNVNLVQLRFIGDNLTLPDTVDFYVDNFRIDAWFNPTAASTNVVSSEITGSGGLVKAGDGVTRLTGSNSFAGTAAVTQGTLELDSAGGPALTGSAVSVAAGATLLIARTNQIAGDASVTLSGGTIERAGGAGAEFGDLGLAANSLIDFGSGATGNLTFGSYAPVHLLSVTNFAPGNTLVFANDLSNSISNPSLFNFDSPYVYSWSGSAFTITAIPEPDAVWAGIAIASLLVAARLRRGRRPAHRPS